VEVEKSLRFPAAPFPARAGAVRLSRVIALTARSWQGPDPRLTLLAGKREGEGPECVLNMF